MNDDELCLVNESGSLPVASERQHRANGKKDGVQIVLAMQNRREGAQMANKYVKRCLTSLVIREMQIKATMRYHFIPTRMAIIIYFKKKCWRGVEKLESSYIAGGNVK